MITRATCTTFDGVANIACGLLTLSSRRFWAGLGLPSLARRPAGVAMFCGGVSMLSATMLVSREESPSWAYSLQATSSVGNFVWAGLGLAAARGGSLYESGWSLQHDGQEAGGVPHVVGAQPVGVPDGVGANRVPWAGRGGRLVVSTVAFYDGAMGVAKLVSR